MSVLRDEGAVQPVGVDLRVCAQERHPPKLRLAAAQDPAGRLPNVHNAIFHGHLGVFLLDVAVDALEQVRLRVRIGEAPEQAARPPQPLLRGDTVTVPERFSGALPLIPHAVLPPLLEVGLRLHF